MGVITGAKRALQGPFPLEKFWISDVLRSFLVQSGTNRDCYSIGIHLNHKVHAPIMALWAL